MPKAIDWTTCTNCKKIHLGLKFVSECQGVPLRCPDCLFGKMRDLTEEEIDAIKRMERGK